jgi:uncharacterized membrane protein
METTSSTRLPASIFVFLALVGAVQAHSYASRMPPTMVSHFGSSGNANGWQTQTGFFTLEVIAVVLAAVIGFGVPRIMGAVPISLIKVPNKEPWFAPERRESTLAFFRVQFAWFGVALLTFLLCVNELVFRANLTSPRQLNSTAFTLAMAAFLIFVAVWTVRMIGHFSKTPS